MVDLSRPQSGTIGPSCWFSDIFVAALKGHFTGGMLIRAEEGDRALFFRNGDPVHAGGGGFPDHYLGQVVVTLGLAPAPVVLEAIQHQESIPEAERPLLGEVLAAKAGLSAEAIEKAVRHQTEARFAACFGLGAGAFQAAPGEDERLRTVGVPVEGWPVLLRGLTEHGSTTELRETSDALLGKSVKLKGSLRQLQALMTLPREIEQFLRYLDKPRKPDQLERALDRRRARGMLRLLGLLELLEQGPAAKAIPIPKATLLKSQLPGSRPDAAPMKKESRGPDEGGAAPAPARPRAPRGGGGPSSSEARAPRSGGSGGSVGTGGSGSASPTTNVSPERVEAVERFYAQLGALDHFGVLGVERDDPPTLVRKRFTDLAKKYHPDAFSGSGVPDEVADKVRAISARINEAYHVLASADARMEYESMLGDARIRGDTRRAELVRDAELKVKMALMHLNRREYDKARALLRNAVENDPHTKSYQAHLAWSMWADPKFDRDLAEKEGLPMLLEAVKADEENATVHFYLGRVYKSQDKLRQALQHFRTAARLDPSFVDAVREARLLKGRLQKAAETNGKDVRGAISRFFKR